MSKLHEYQNLLSAYVLAAPGAPAPVALMDSAHNQTTAAARFGIYKNNVYAHLIEALEASFPAVKRLVGDDFFRFAARSYIPLHPPHSATLLDFGGSFVEFLEGFEPAASVPYLSDVARLERLYLRAYHAPEILPLKGEHFTQHSSADRTFMRLGLHPSAGLMTSPYPVSRIWEMNLRDEDVEEIELSPEFEHLLVVRPKAQVEVRSLSPGAYAMVFAIRLGRTLAEAIAEGHRADEKFEPERQLGALIEGETFTAFQKTDRDSG